MEHSSYSPEGSSVDRTPLIFQEKQEKPKDVETRKGLQTLFKDVVKGRRESPTLTLDESTLASDLPPGASEEIKQNWEAIQTSSIKTPFIVPSSGRAYARQGDRVFYNSKPSEKKIWGEISETKTAYILFKNDFHSFYGVGNHSIFNNLRSYRVYQLDNNENELFYENGDAFQKKGKIWVMNSTYDTGENVFYKKVDEYITQCDRDGITEKEHKERLTADVRRQFPELIKNGDSYSFRLEGASYNICYMGQMTFQNGEIKTQFRPGGPWISLDQFKENVQETVELTKEKILLRTQIDSTPEEDKTKAPYFEKVKRFFEVCTRLHELISGAIDFKNQQWAANQLVWLSVQTQGGQVPYDTVSVYATTMDDFLQRYGVKEGTRYMDEFDTLAQYYSQAGNAEKAKFYANVILALPANENTSSYQKTAREILKKFPD